MERRTLCLATNASWKLIIAATEQASLNYTQSWTSFHWNHLDFVETDDSFCPDSDYYPDVETELPVDYEVPTEEAPPEDYEAPVDEVLVEEA